MNSFLWGAATSSHQVEGGNIHNDWWKFEQGGGVEDGSHSGRATDHWNRFREDLRRAAEMGLNSYRFSIEWSRLQPEEQSWDESAFEWYEELLGECERWSLLPMLTLHHFTLPRWLAEKGGFSNSESVAAFTNFVRRVATRLGARVPLWCTVNEPIGLIAGQYLAGYMPPATFDPVAATNACRHLLQCHVAAYEAVHRETRVRTGPWRDYKVAVGVAHNLIDFMPSREWHPMERLASLTFHRLYNRAWLDAITGKKQHFGLAGIMPYAPQVREALGRKTVDFIGINYYLKAYLRWRPRGGHFESISGLPFGVAFSDGSEPVSEMGWASHPEGLRRVIRFTREYELPIYITENGVADGKDGMRPKYLLDHLRVVAEEIARGTDIRGYYYWSLLDNFEWIKGFHPRFGLLEVDYETFERTARPSAKLLARIIAAHRDGDHAPRPDLIPPLQLL